MLEVMAGIALAVFLFAALLWSIYRAVVTEGFARSLAVGLSLATVFGMLSLTFLWVIPARVAGGALVMLGLTAIWSDPGWSKLLPFIQAVFGIALIVGLPWLTA